MSIGDKLQGIINSKSAIKNSITNKGVTVPENAMLSDCPALIDAIQQGGGSNDLVEGVDFLLVNSIFGSSTAIKAIAMDNGDILLSETSGISKTYKLNRELKTWEVFINNGLIVAKMFVDSLGNTYFITISPNKTYRYSPDGVLTELPTNDGGNIVGSTNKWYETDNGDIIVYPSSSALYIYILNKLTNVFEATACKGGYASYAHYFKAKNGDLYFFGDKLMRFNSSISVWEYYNTNLRAASKIYEKSTGEIFLVAGYQSYPYIKMFSPQDSTIYDVYTGDANNYRFSEIVEVGDKIFFSSYSPSFGKGIHLYDETTKTIIKVSDDTRYYSINGFVVNNNIYLLSNMHPILKFNTNTNFFDLFYDKKMGLAIEVDGGYILGSPQNDSQGLLFFNSSNESISVINTMNYGLYPNMFFRDKNNVLCFYTRGNIAYWDSMNKSLVNFGNYNNYGYTPIHIDSKGTLILSSAGQAGVYVHRSITDSPLSISIGTNYLILSINPLLVYCNNNIIYSWDEELQTFSIYGYSQIFNANIIGRLRAANSFLSEPISGKNYFGFNPASSITKLDTSYNSNYGIGYVKNGTDVKILIV